MQVKKQVRIGHEQRTGPKSGKEYMYTVYYNPDYAEYIMRNVGLDEAQAGMRLFWETYQ